MKITHYQLDWSMKWKQCIH